MMKTALPSRQPRYPIPVQQWQETMKSVLSDPIWEEILTILPPPGGKKKRGRPRMDDRQVLVAILYQQRTRCPWKLLPPELGAASTLYDRWVEWRQAGVFDHLSQILHQSGDDGSGGIPPPPFAC